MMKKVPTNLKELSQMSLEFSRKKYPNVPEFALAKKSFKDKTANDLTKAIIFDIDHIRSGSAYRINNGAVYDNKRGVYRAGVQKKGIPDIIGVIDGRFVGIEVKIGKDRQSQYQVNVQREIENAGGVYFIAKTFADYAAKMTYFGFDH
jgi:hypothetical protein